MKYMSFGMGSTVEGGLGVELVAGFPHLLVVVELVVDDVVDVEKVVHHLALVGVRTLRTQQALVGAVPVVELDDMPHHVCLAAERLLAVPAFQDRTLQGSNFGC